MNAQSDNYNKHTQIGSASGESDCVKIKLQH